MPVATAPLRRSKRVKINHPHTYEVVIDRKGEVIRCGSNDIFDVYRWMLDELRLSPGIPGSGIWCEKWGPGDKLLGIMAIRTTNFVLPPKLRKWILVNEPMTPEVQRYLEAIHELTNVHPLKV